MCCLFSVDVVWLFGVVVVVVVCCWLSVFVARCCLFVVCRLLVVVWC